MSVSSVDEAINIIRDHPNPLALYVFSHRRCAMTFPLVSAACRPLLLKGPAGAVERATGLGVRRTATASHPCLSVNWAI